MSVKLAVELAVIVLWAGVHLLAGKLRFLERVPRSRYLSAAGGVSVSYVFLHLLPELRAHAHEHQWAHPLLIETTALAGLVTFYSLERLMARRRDGSSSGSSAGWFWLHLGSFGVYNVLAGLLLATGEAEGVKQVVLAGLALGLHFLVNDQGLAHHHGERYRRMRWLLALAPAAGWLGGVSLAVPPKVPAAVFAFLAGGIILNTLKEELPEERESRFPSFIAGAAIYGALLMVLG